MGSGRIIFCFFCGLFLLTSSGRFHTVDEVLPFYQSDSLVRGWGFAVPQAVWTDFYYGRSDRTGMPQAPYGPGQAVLAVPFRLLGDLVAPLFQTPDWDEAVAWMAAERRPLYSLNAALLPYSWAVSLLPALAMAGVLALLPVLLGRLGYRRRTGVTVALALGLGTALWPYATWCFSEALTAFCLTGAATLLVRDPVRSREAWLAGGVLGLAILIRPTMAVVLPCYLVFAWRASGWRPAHWGALLLPVGLAGAAYLGFNLWRFGDPLQLGYPPAAEGGRQLNRFETLPWVGAAGLLISPGKGLVLFAPPVLLALAGLGALWRKRPALLWLGLAPMAALLALYATYNQWEGGYCYGPRYLVPALPLMAIPLAAWWETGRSRRGLLLGLLVGAGLLVQLLGVTTNFVEHQQQAGYYDEGYVYQLSYTPFFGQADQLLAGIRSPTRGADLWPRYALALGASSTAVLGVLWLEVLLFLVGAWGLLRLLQRPETG